MLFHNNIAADFSVFLSTVNWMAVCVPSQRHLFGVMLVK